MSYPHRGLDIRVWFVSFCLFAFTIICSLIILLAMEATSSDLLFTPGSDIHTYAVVSASLASTVLIGTFLAVVSVWFHLRRIQLPSILGTALFSLTIAFTLFWAASLLGGHWGKHMERNYHQKYWNPFINKSMVADMLASGSSPYYYHDYDEASYGGQDEAERGGELLKQGLEDFDLERQASYVKEANNNNNIVVLEDGGDHGGDLSDGKRVASLASPPLTDNSQSLSPLVYTNKDGDTIGGLAHSDSDDDSSTQIVQFVDAAFLGTPPSREDTISILRKVGRERELSYSFRMSKHLIENCPEAVPSLHCCGWEQRCPARCNLTTTCKRAAESEASDFAIKLIVVCSLIMLMITACVGITMWRSCGGLSDALEDD